MASTSITDNPSLAALGDAPTAADLQRRDERLRRRESLLRTAVPIAVVAGLLLLWEVLVRVNHVPHYIIPAPSLILTTLVDGRDDGVSTEGCGRDGGKAPVET